MRLDESFLELKNADLHDLRDTDTTRELYVAESQATGIKRNRKRVFVVRAEVVAIALNPRCWRYFAVPMSQGFGRAKQPD